jgi:HK97 family phage major capsid protein
MRPNESDSEFLARMRASHARHGAAMGKTLTPPEKITPTEEESALLAERDAPERRVHPDREAEASWRNAKVQAERRRYAYRAGWRDYVRYGSAGINEATRSLLVAWNVDPANRDPATLAAETRDQSVGTNSAGGFVVPSALLPRFTLGLKSGSAMVRAATVVETTSGGKLAWPTSDDTGNVGAIQAEGTAVSTQDVTIGTRQLSAFMYTSKLVKVSEQLAVDTGFPFDSWLIPMLARRIARAANAHFTLGTGGGAQPSGLIPNATAALTAASSSAVTYTEMAALLAAVDAEYLEPDLEDAPPVGHVGWMMSSSTLRALRAVSDGDGGGSIVVDGRPAKILGFPVMINNDMPGFGINSRPVAFGAFGAAYVVRQAKATTRVLRLNERFADALQIGFICQSSLDGTVDDPVAVKVIQMAAT